MIQHRVHNFGTCLVTTQTYGRRALFKVDELAKLLVATLKALCMVSASHGPVLVRSTYDDVTGLARNCIANARKGRKMQESIARVAESKLREIAKEAKR
jgi:hypothetical protein